METLIILLSPFVPHICEELWEKMGHEIRLVNTPWPSFDSDLAREDSVVIVVQVNGKLRDRIEVERDLNEDLVKEMAMGLRRVRNLIQENKIKKIIYVKNKLINIVL